MERLDMSSETSIAQISDSVEAAKHIAEGLRILAKIIAREIVQETMLKNNKKEVFQSKTTELLYSQKKLALSVSEVSKLLGLSRSITYELIRTSQIPSIRLGRRILVPQAKLEMMPA